MKFITFLAILSLASAAQAGSSWDCSYKMDGSIIRVNAEWLRNNTGDINDHVLLLRQTASSRSSKHNLAVYSPTVKMPKIKDGYLMKNWVGFKYSSAKKTDYDIDVTKKMITVNEIGKPQKSAPIDCKYSPGGE
jgi:hypothetical protein